MTLVSVSHGVSSTVRCGASAAALRIWMFLAMTAQHAPFTRELRDGQRVSVAWGQVLSSSRVLQKDVGYRSPKAVIADLAELESNGTIATKRVIRQRFQNENASLSNRKRRSASKTETQVTQSRL